MKKTILLIEDDPGVCRMLFRVLAEEDYLVVAARNGDEGLIALETREVDLVLLDLSIGHGWETFERLIALRSSLPFIVITSRANERFPEGISTARVLMEKPLDLPSLLRAIEELLGSVAAF